MEMLATKSKMRRCARGIKHRRLHAGQLVQNEPNRLTRSFDPGHLSLTRGPKYYGGVVFLPA
eukprot:scaffold100605_cov29-Prasinocladus_malaysianus.AAC.1